MGLFSFIKKAAGKVLGAGLSFVTHGASDKVIKAFKGSGGSKSPQQQQALIAKLTPPTPKTSRTESVVPGWGFHRDGYGAERESGKRARAQGKPRAARRGLYERAGAAMASTATTAKRRRKPPAARSGVKRGPPKGGLDLRALSVAWRAAGKPGTWPSWIREQGSNYRVN